jgi:hypothetical protein
MRHFFLMGLFCLTQMAATAQAAGCEPVNENAALAAEDERYAAQLQSDVTALDRLLADDLVYIHSNAQVDSKQAFIESLRSGAVKYLSMKRSDVRVRTFGCVAVITGLANYDVHFNGKDISVDLRFHSVWARRDGRLQFISWQSTRTPAKSP